MNHIRQRRYGLLLESSSFKRCWDVVFVSYDVVVFTSSLHSHTLHFNSTTPHLFIYTFTVASRRLISNTDSNRRPEPATTTTTLLINNNNTNKFMYLD